MENRPDSKTSEHRHIFFVNRADFRLRSHFLCHIWPNLPDLTRSDVKKSLLIHHSKRLRAFRYDGKPEERILYCAPFYLQAVGYSF